MARKQKKAKPNVSQLKKLIGTRIREMRGEISQEAIEVASGVDRGIIGKIERGTSDYRINSLLRVLQALRPESDQAIFAADPLEKSLHDSISRVYKAGIPSETQFVMEALRRAEAAINSNQARASNQGTLLSKPQRPA